MTSKDSWRSGYTKRRHRKSHKEFKHGNSLECWLGQNTYRNYKAPKEYLKLLVTLFNRMYASREIGQNWLKSRFLPIPRFLVQIDVTKVG